MPPVVVVTPDWWDRCVQLTWETGQEDPGAWVELISKIKEGVIYAVDYSINQREEEVKRSEGQRLMPGWNFCTFFILKVCKVQSISDNKRLQTALGESLQLLRRPEHFRRCVTTI